MADLPMTTCTTDRRCHQAHRLTLLALASAMVAAAVLLPAPSAQASAATSTATHASTNLAPQAFAQAVTATLTTASNTSKYLGPALSGIVVDPADGAVLWRHDDAIARMPASTQKLLTTYSVLHSMSPDATLSTRVLQSAQDPAVIYLRGGGDPSLTVSRLTALAQQTAAALTTADGSGSTPADPTGSAPGDPTATVVTLYVDASIFPAATPATGWKAGYLGSDVQPVQGLTLAGYRKPDGALAAGRAFASALASAGVTALLTSAAPTPSDAVELASSQSPPVRSMLAHMLAFSDNDYAEALLRQAALARGRQPSWAGALGNETALLSGAGIPLAGLRAYDGSGLSRSDRMPVATLAAVVRALWTNPADASVVFAWGAIPRSGQTGTLANRYRDASHACATGQVLAKTGSLTDAATLAGLAHGSDGRDRVFVFLDNGLSGKYTQVSAALDTLATTVVGCRLG